MKSVFEKGSLFFLLFCLIVSPNVQALIIRHDVPENKYAQLAKEKRFDCVGYFYEGATAKHQVKVVAAPVF